MCGIAPPCAGCLTLFRQLLGRRWDSMSVGINERSQSQIAPVMDSTSPRVHRVTEILPPAPELIRKPRGL